MNTLRRDNHNLTFSQVNITNLVDVALTLVVVLLIIAPFIEQGIEVKLPVSSPGKIKGEEALIVTVAPEDVYYINDYIIYSGRREQEMKTSLSSSRVTVMSTTKIS